MRNRAEREEKGVKMEEAEAEEEKTGEGRRRDLFNLFRVSTMNLFRNKFSYRLSLS